MIDHTFLNTYNKDLPKECYFIKSLISVLNDSKAHMLNIKSTFELEFKEIEMFKKNIIANCKNFNSEAITQNYINEDVSNLINSIQYYAIEQEKYCIHYIEHYNSIINKINYEQINSISNNENTDLDIIDINNNNSIFNETQYLIKEYISCKNKYKLVLSRIDKLIKDLNYYVTEKRKEEEKKTYNVTVKNKIEDKIVKLISEYNELIDNKNTISKDTISNENYLNESIVNLSELTIKTTYYNLVRFKYLFESVLDGKLALYNNLNKEVGNIVIYLSKINIIEGSEILNLYNKHKQNNLTKNNNNNINNNNNNNNNNLYIINNNTVHTFNLNDISINNQYTIDNFYTSSIAETININLSYLIQNIGIKKKIITSYAKFIKELIKNNEYFASSFSKFISKSMYNFNSIISNNYSITNTYISLSNYNSYSSLYLSDNKNSSEVNFIIQMNEVFRSINDIVLKKLNDHIKNYNSYNSFLEFQIRELISDENQYNIIYNKFNKEWSTYKELINKNSLYIDKLNSNIDTLKEEIDKNIEDKFNNSKFGTRLEALRIEENSLKKEKLNVYNKSKTFLEDNLNQAKSLIIKGYNTISEKNEEIKNYIILFEKQHIKIIEEIQCFIDVYKCQVFTNNNDVQHIIKKIFCNYFNNVVLSKDTINIIDRKHLLSINNDNNDKVLSYINKIFSDKFFKSTKELKNTIIKDNNNNNEDISLPITNTSFMSPGKLRNTYSTNTTSSFITYSNNIEKFNINIEINIINYIEDKHLNKDIAIPENILSTEELKNYNIIINKEKNLLLNNFTLDNTTAKEENKVLNDLDATKSNNNSFINNLLSSNANNNNVNNDKKHEGIFSIEDNETVVSSFSCAYSDKILLQGKMYVTTKKIVFYSWFNGMTLFGKTLIEIPNIDIIDIQKKKNLLFDNSILIQTKNNEFFFTSFISRKECFVCLEETLNFKKNDVDKDLENKVDLNVANEEIKSDIVNIGSKNISPKNSIDLNVKNNNNDDILINNNNNNNNNNSINNLNINSKSNNDDLTNEFKKNNSKKDIKTLLSDYNIIENLNNLTIKNIKLFKDKNNFNIQETFLTKYLISNAPLHLVFNYIYNPEKINQGLGYEKNYFHSYKLSLNNTNIKVEYNKEDLITNIPSYYKLCNKYSTHEKVFNFTNTSEKEIKTFNDMLISEMHRNSDYLSLKENNFNSFNVLYSSNHPIPNPKFMGPKKLDIKEEPRIYFISPTCFIAEHYVNLSGFMMMDTFYIIKRFTFECDIIPNFDKNCFEYKTYITEDFVLEFVKSTMFKDKILRESTADNKENSKKEIIPKLEKGLTGINEELLLRESNYTEDVKNNNVEFNDNKYNKSSFIENNFEISNINNSNNNLTNLNIDKVDLNNNNNKNELNSLNEKNNITFENNKNIIKDLNNSSANNSSNNNNSNNDINNRIKSVNKTMHKKESLLECLYKTKLYAILLFAILIISMFIDTQKINTIISIFTIYGFLIIYFKLDNIENKIKINSNNI